MFEQFQKVVAEIFGHLTDPEEIAAMCREKQVQGFQQNISSNPLCKLVREQVDFPVYFQNNKWFIWVGNRNIGFSCMKVCEDFLNNFSDGKYPDLIATANAPK
jgi:hypothetical protein